MNAFHTLHISLDTLLRNCKVSINECCRFADYSFIIGIHSIIIEKTAIKISINLKRFNSITQ